QKPRHLHGQGRAAGLNAPAGDELRRGPDKSERIDAAMRAEALVLIRKQHGEEARIDIRDTGGEAPAAPWRRVSAQQPPVAIDDAGRKRNVFAERRRAERSDPPRASAERASANNTCKQNHQAGSFAVFASEAKQSRDSRRLDCFVALLLAMTSSA